MLSYSDKIKILVADDEALARQRVLKFLNESDKVFEVYEASNGKETILQISNVNPDILFLDIKMTDMTGFDVLRQLPEEEIPIVIFVTAFDSFAVKAFEVQAIDFLLKPYKKERFKDSLERAITQLELNSRKVFQSKVTKLMEILNDERSNLDPYGSNFVDSLVLKRNKKYYFVRVNEIKHIKSSGYYAEIFTLKGEKHVHRISMSQLMEQLDPQVFSRISRSTIVEMNSIKEIVSEGQGDFSVIMNDGLSFQISKKYKIDFLRKMGIR